jgi:large conductance mechanosensitive channel
LFANTIINFIVVALALFALIRGINRLQTKPLPADATPPPPPEDVVLLREIRDLLKSR